MNKEKILTIVGYVGAIPLGILAYMFSALLLTLNTPIQGYETYGGEIIRFIWINFGHILAFFWGVNVALPAHRFIITVILSSIIGTIFLILFLLYLYWNLLNLEIIASFILVILSLVVSCTISYKNGFNKN